jgi:putative ABC transport system ATP-binding protein
VIVLDKVSKHYTKPLGTIKALDAVELRIDHREFAVIQGSSGSGKTTLLLTIGGMLRPSYGRLTVAGIDPYNINRAGRLAFRAEKIGFVFQLFHLVPYLTVFENVLFPSGSSSCGSRDLKTRARSLLEQMGLLDRAEHLPMELSAGEKQRVAIARAMIKKPEIILADEPTGNLDPENAAGIARCLAEAHSEGCTVVVVTHGRDCDPYAETIIRLEQGRITSRKEQSLSTEWR